MFSSSFSLSITRLAVQGSTAGQALVALTIYRYTEQSLIATTFAFAFVFTVTIARLAVRSSTAGDTLFAFTVG